MNRSGVRSHIRAQHSPVSLHPAQPQPFNTNTTPNRAHLRPEIVLLGSPPPYSPLSSSDESEEKTSSHEEDHGILMDLDQPPWPSPLQSGSTSVHVGDDDNHREPSSVGSGTSGDQHQVIPKLTRIYHPVINGRPCDKDGNDIPQGAPPPPEAEHDIDDWTPYGSRAEFELADFLFTREQMSGGNIDELLGIWAATVVADGAEPPFRSCKDLYSTIDSTPYLNCPWEIMQIRHNDTMPEHDVPSWMTTEYTVWYRNPRMLVKNILSNRGFNGEFDRAPFQEHDMDDNHRFQNFMSGNWCWGQAVRVVWALSRTV